MAPNEDKNKRLVLRFGLLIEKHITEEGTDIFIKHYNAGVSLADTILSMEAWLDEAKKRFKGNISMDFGNKED